MVKEINVDKYKTQQEFENISELRNAIIAANSVRKINELRMSCVKFMKEDSSVLKEWQNKYWSLKRCPTCGKNR